jgi:hypothetical protein
MLPGLRFLFAAIVLSIAMLVFGLGAAALLRAAHQEFASIPSRRAPPETMFAQRSQAEPTLALVRIEAPEADQKAATPTADNMQDQPAIDSVPPEPDQPAAETDKIAALTDAAIPLENSPSSDAPNPDASTSGIPVQVETPAQADTPSPAAETKLAAIAVVTAEPDRATATAPDQAATPPIDDSTRVAETRIATLGGPPVTIEPQTPSKRATALVKKPVQARHVVKRRKIVQPARIARPAPQRPANPFGTPFGS